MKRGRTPVLVLWLGCLALAAIIVARAHYITDMSAFLPARPTAAQQLLVDQLRDGAASRLILAAIEGSSTAERSRLSVAIAARLRTDAQFASVNNGEPVTADRDREFLFQHRYVLSDQVTAARFSVPGLHAAIQDTIDNLASPAGLLLKSLLPNDPTGEFLHILDQVGAASAPATQDGVWVSADTTRALLAVQTAAAGSDTDAQEHALQAIRAAFSASVRQSADATARAARLKLSGPGVFAVAARSKIKNAAIRLSLVSSLLVIALLLAVYRSVPALVLGLLPVTTGAVIGIAAVAAGFGAVHGITLGFGITLIGESVDYSIYFFVQSDRQRENDDSTRWQRLWWPTIRLGMLTSVCGFASLLPSGFPGLAQLGLYSISGLVAAALVTRFVLPALLPRGFAIHDVAPLGANIAAALGSWRKLKSRTTTVLWCLLAAVALIVLNQHRATLWNRELAALSPVPQEDLAYDARLRADLGAADGGTFVVVSASTLQDALRGAEGAAGALKSLTDAGAIGGFDSPANYLPSQAAQAARREALPEAAKLRADLTAATANLPLHSERLQPFLQDMEVARHAPGVNPSDLRGTSLESGFNALIMHAHDRWTALLPLHPATQGPIDGARIGAALEAAHDDARIGAHTDARVLDLKLESNALYGGYLAEVMHLTLAGFLALVVLLGITLRSPLRVVRVLLPLVFSVLLVTCGLVLGGVQLTLLHLVGMLLIVAVGSNYALFFDRQASTQEAAGEALTLASLAIANASTVIGFGLLSFSQVPVLVALGTTVAPGAFLALVFAALLSRAPRRATALPGPIAPGAAGGAR